MVQPAFPLKFDQASAPTLQRESHLTLVSELKAADQKEPPQFLVRSCAYLIDIVLIGVVTALISHICFYAYQTNAASFGLLPLRLRDAFHLELFKQAVGLVVFTTYMTLSLWYSNGFTCGKYLMKIRAVYDDNSYDWTLAKALFRSIGYQLSYMIFGLGFALPLLRRDKKTLHDLVSRTKVIAIS